MECRAWYCVLEVISSEVPGTLDAISNSGILGMQPELFKLVALKGIIICYGCNSIEQSISVTGDLFVQTFL